MPTDTYYPEDLIRHPSDRAQSNRALIEAARERRQPRVIRPVYRLGKRHGLFLMMFLVVLVATVAAAWYWWPTGTWEAQYCPSGSDTCALELRKTGNGFLNRSVTGCAEVVNFPGPRRMGIRIPTRVQVEYRLVPSTCLLTHHPVTLFK